MAYKNTGFFHASTKKRKTLNKLTVIEGLDGKLVYTEEDITETMEMYFVDIFKPIEREPGAMEIIINETILPIISEETNQRRICLPEAKELKDALFSIHHGKAP